MASAIERATKSNNHCIPGHVLVSLFPATKVGRTRSEMLDVFDSAFFHLFVGNALDLGFDVFIRFCSWVPPPNLLPCAELALGFFKSRNIFVSPIVQIARRTFRVIWRGTIVGNMQMPVYGHW